MILLIVKPDICKRQAETSVIFLDLALGPKSAWKCRDRIVDLLWIPPIIEVDMDYMH